MSEPRSQLISYFQIQIMVPKTQILDQSSLVTAKLGMVEIAGHRQ